MLRNNNYAARISSGARRFAEEELFNTYLNRFFIFLAIMTACGIGVMGYALSLPEKKDDNGHKVENPQTILYLNIALGLFSPLILMMITMVMIILLAFFKIVRI